MMFQAIINFQLKLHLVLLYNGSILVQGGSRSVHTYSSWTCSEIEPQSVKPRINIDTEGAKSPSNTWKLFKLIDLRSIHKTSCPRIGQCWAFWASYFVTGHAKLITWFISDRRFFFSYFIDI